MTHQEGNLKEAERLYRLILQTQPQHPDTNHSFGLIAVSIDQAAAALLLFNITVEELTRAQQFETAQQVITEGKKNGVAAEDLNP